MLSASFVILLLATNAYPSAGATGTITGVVVNGTRSDEPVAGVTVQLRASAEGAFEPIAAETTDRYGRFAFYDLPVDSAITYLAGANFEAVHYPGQRVRLDARSPSADVRIIAYEAVRDISPLAATRHDIDISIKDDIMHVAETIVVSNPSLKSYIGIPQGDRGSVTLRLSIPPNFDRVTFQREFFGRRFQIIDHRLVTELPWTPGDKLLQFSYRLPAHGADGAVFRRTLDVPSSNVRLRVKATDAKQISCNLSPPSISTEGVIFTSLKDPLPSGFLVELQLGTKPLPWMLTARWGSVFALCMLVLGTVWVNRYFSEKRGKVFN